MDFLTILQNCEEFRDLFINKDLVEQYESLIEQYNTKTVGTWSYIWEEEEIKLKELISAFKLIMDWYGCNPNKNFKE